MAETALPTFVENPHSRHTLDLVAPEAPCTPAELTYAFAEAANTEAGADLAPGARVDIEEDFWEMWATVPRWAIQPGTYWCAPEDIWVRAHTHRHGDHLVTEARLEAGFDTAWMRGAEAVVSTPLRGGEVAAAVGTEQLLAEFANSFDGA